MSKTVKYMEQMDSELKSFQKLLSETLSNESTIQNKYSDLWVKYELILKENGSLKQENEVLGEQLRNGMEKVSKFVESFQKNIEEMGTFQKIRKEMVESLKSSTQLNVQYEHEIQRLKSENEAKAKELGEVKESVDIVRKEYVGRLDGLMKEFKGFVARSLSKSERKRVEELELLVRQKEEQIEQVIKTKNAETQLLEKKLNNKQMEIDLLKIDYKRKKAESLSTPKLSKKEEKQPEPEKPKKRPKTITMKSTSNRRMKRKKKTSNHNTNEINEYINNFD